MHQEFVVFCAACARYALTMDLEPTPICGMNGHIHMLQLIYKDMIWNFLGRRNDGTISPEARAVPKAFLPVGPVPASPLPAPTAWLPAEPLPPMNLGQGTQGLVLQASQTDLTPRLLSVPQNTPLFAPYWQPVQQQQQQLQHKPQRETEQELDELVQALNGLLSDPSYSRIIYWSPCGRKIIIRSQIAFAEIVLGPGQRNKFEGQWEVFENLLAFCGFLLERDPDGVTTFWHSGGLFTRDGQDSQTLFGGLNWPLQDEMGEHTGQNLTVGPAPFEGLG